jgi:protein farnesyltransferase subunit beta
MSKPTPQSSSQPPSARLEELLTPSSDRIEELSDSETYDDMVEAEPTQITQEFPEFEMFLSPLRDELVTESSEVEKETLEDVLPFLEGNPYDFDLNSFGLPKLQRAKHAIFLRNALGEYPPQFAAMDAARPWLLYWSLQGLTCLGEDVSEYRER